MAVGVSDKNPLLPVAGIRLSACSAGICKKDRPDLAIMAIEDDANITALFTRNAFCAAPVTVARDHLRQNPPAYFLINAGNANAGMGQQGIEDAVKTCSCLANQARVPVSAVIPFSTGVIGEPLPAEKICQAIPQLYDSLSENSWDIVAKAIMTTDTIRKGVSRQFEIDGKKITITGIAKGSGMIKPDMATMLAFIGTDAAVEMSTLQKIFKEKVDRSFNHISVDGDTSTNDACVLVATGKAGNELIDDTSSENALVFKEALEEVCLFLAHSVIRDGEGATKFITLNINGGKSNTECQHVAETIAHSPLVKTALFASDPNWGRILAAVGRAGLENFNIEDVQIFLDDVCIVDKGGRARSYTEEAGREVLEKCEFNIRVELNRGNAEFQFWTCDLSYDYVRINAEYRT